MAHQCCGLDDKVVDRKFAALAGRERLVELAPQRDEFVHPAVDGQVVVRDGLLALQQALGGDALYVGHGDVLVVRVALRTRTKLVLSACPGYQTDDSVPGKLWLHSSASVCICRAHITDC